MADSTTACMGPGTQPRIGLKNIVKGCGTWGSNTVKQHHVSFTKERGIRTYVHGDDYVSIGTTKDLIWLKERFESKCKVKTETLGPEEGQCKEVKILNRIVSWHSSEGFIYDADPRHAEIIIEQLNLQNVKPVSMPRTKEEGRTQPGWENKLSNIDGTKYRAMVARCNYLSPDRPDIAYIVKELARRMTYPNEGDWQKLKRLGRYLPETKITARVQVANRTISVEGIQRCRLGRLQRE